MVILQQVQLLAVQILQVFVRMTNLGLTGDLEDDVGHSLDVFSPDHILIRDPLAQAEVARQIGTPPAKRPKNHCHLICIAALQLRM